MQIPMVIFLFEKPFYKTSLRSKVVPFSCSVVCSPRSISIVDFDLVNDRRVTLASSFVLLNIVTRERHFWSVVAAFLETNI